jgi:hypothetical protein
MLALEEGPGRVWYLYGAALCEKLCGNGSFNMVSVEAIPVHFPGIS